MTCVFSLRFRCCCVIREYNNILKSPVCIRHGVLMLQVGVLEGTYETPERYKPLSKTCRLIIIIII